MLYESERVEYKSRMIDDICEEVIAFANTDKVNLRSRASSTEGQIIGKVRTGMRLRIADYGKNWCLVVTPEGKRGYVMTGYLEFE